MGRDARARHVPDKPRRRGDDGRYSPEDAARMRAALWEHYPEDYPELDPNRQDQQ